MDTSELGQCSKQKTFGPAKEELPRYQLIACDVAAKIAAGTYPEGTRLYARSALASQYGVSSETARRAICVLTDLGIVESTKGSGITVISAEKAVAFVRQYHQADSMAELRNALRDGVARYQEDLKNIFEILEQLKNKAARYYSTNPFVPYQLRLTDRCPQLGKSLQELNFWHNTLATVIAIGRGEKVILSPGPYESLCPGDILYYIGNPECVERVARLLVDDAEDH